jgi:hypothetical protein
MGGAMAGSVIGHGISNMIFGGRAGEAAAPPPPAEYAEAARAQTGGCDIPAKGGSARKIRLIFSRLYKVLGSYERRYDFVQLLPRGIECVPIIGFGRVRGLTHLQKRASLLPDHTRVYNFSE